MKRTRRLILSCLLLFLLLLTACGQRETVYQISADRLTQAAHGRYTPRTAVPFPNIRAGISRWRLCTLICSDHPKNL